MTETLAKLQRERERERKKKKKVKAYKPKEPRICQDKAMGGYRKTD